MPVDELTERDYLQSVWQALRRIETAISALTLPPPEITVTAPPPDLAEVVTAVTSLKPGPSAVDIADALAAVLRPGSSTNGDGEALGQLAAELKLLNHRIQGMGTQAYGGGSVSLQPDQSVTVANPTADPETGLAKDATLLRRYGDHVTKAGFTTTAGDNTLHTPAAGKKIRLYWIALSSSQDNAAENLIQVKLTDSDGTVKYRWRMGNPGAFAGSRTIEGNANEALVLELANTNGIDWNVDLEEVT
jgi:hypothetical protein